MLNTSKRTHKTIALWCLSFLCGCSDIDVGGPHAPLTNPTTISEESKKEVAEDNHSSESSDPESVDFGRHTFVEEEEGFQESEPVEAILKVVLTSKLASSTSLS